MQILVSAAIFISASIFHSGQAVAGEDGGTIVTLRTVTQPQNATVALPEFLSEFDLQSSLDRAKLSVELGKLLQLAEAQKKDARKNIPNIFPYAIGGGGKKALEHCQALLEQVHRGGREGREAAKWIQIILTSFNHDFDPPVQTSHQIPGALVKVIRGLVHKRITPDDEGDGGRKDPVNSNYWASMPNDGTVDLKAGFGRAAPVNMENEICAYDSAKDGWGAHPGFNVQCKGEEYKFKLGDEIYSGPFNTRIYWLVGYNVTPIDRIDEMKVAYDRRILSEFHSRKHLAFSVNIFNQPLHSFVVTNYTDPFSWISHAKLKDGRKIPGMQLKKLLLKYIPAGDVTKREYKRPEVIPGNFREDLESQIEYLAFVPGALGHKSKSIKTIGPWQYNEFERHGLREVRAILILAAWVGNYNMRWENTRLSYVKENGQKNSQWNLKHFLSDVGSGLGTATRVMEMENSRIDDMLWRVTEPYRGDGVKLSGIEQNDVDNKAFKKLTFEDGQWMVRKLAGISEQQIWDALGGAQMPAASRRVAFEKLLSRRIHMIRDFGLAGEYPALVKRKINPGFSFTPTAQDGYGWDQEKVVNGRIVKLKK